MRRKPTKRTDVFQFKAVDPGGGAGGGRNSRNGGDGAIGAGGSAINLGYGLGAGRYRANSADIAEERGTPMYPTARKGEGKILRPQYKEILRGKSFNSNS